MKRQPKFYESFACFFPPSLPAAAGDHFIDGALAQLAQAQERIFEIVVQTAVHPVDQQAEGLTFIGGDQRFKVFLDDRKLAEGRAQVGAHHVFAQAHQRPLHDFAVHGIVDVQHGAPVFENILNADGQALLKRRHIGMAGNNVIGLLLDNRLQQRGNVGKMIVEGIAVDAAFVHDVPNRDFAERLLVQNL